MLIPRRIALATICIYTLAPLAAVAEPFDAPHEQNFMLTAYYSPLPDQCCYIKGSYEADKVLNGQGTHGADGTPVYSGMLAAPPTYAFGTRIVLPGLGTMTVHDRGGAIQEWDDVHRLDVWVGHGEAGLARALEFGVKRIRGTVYPVASEKPAEAFSYESLPAPEHRLKPYIVAEAGLVDLAPTFGEHGLSVRLMQEKLAQLGYFDHEVTGLYGDVTKNSLAVFLTDMKLDEPADKLTDVAAAYIEAALQVNRDKSPVAFVSAESSPADIMTAQRTMRFLGYYRGRTDGQYSTVLFNAILAYQKDQSLVGNETSPGAGRIGPVTKGTLDKEIYRRRIARKAQIILALNRVHDLLAGKGVLVGSTMQEGSNGKDVRILQTLLAKRGFFPADMVNGNFGALTAQSVLAYQLATELLASASDKGAGTVGPVTLKTLRNEQVKEVYKTVRARGWDAI